MDEAPLSKEPVMAVATANLRVTLESLSQSLQSSDSSVRLDAIRSLACLGCKARRAVPALVETLKDPGVAERKLAALALGEIGSRGSIRALRAVLQDADARVRRCAALALMNIGAEASSVAA
jgi:HEAT repeat protein